MFNGDLAKTRLLLVAIEELVIAPVLLTVSTLA